MLRQVFSEYFCFPCQFSLHQMLDTHLSSGAGAVGQIVANIPSGSVSTPPHEKWKCFSLSVYQKGAHYTGIKLCNRPPDSLKQMLHDPQQFQTALKDFIYAQSFYSMDGYFRYKMD
jgi:hypothetical protein